MQSRNPVFARSAGFNGRTNAYGNQTYAGNGQPYPGYGQADAGNGTGLPTHTGTDAGRMTVDSVVQKTTITLLVVFAAAAITWIGTGDITDPHAVRNIGALAGIGAIGGFILSMVNSFKRVINPTLVIAYAALEGVFIGALSKVIDHAVGTRTVDGVTTATGSSGVVIMAVLGTFAAVAGTLAAYKFFHIRVSNKFRSWVIGAAMGFVAVSLLDMVFSAFGKSFGFNDPFTPLGMIASFIGLGLGVFMLILDFDFVERGVAAGLPERESWRAAFGLTVTIVWIYIELLRIIAALRES